MQNTVSQMRVIVLTVVFGLLALDYCNGKSLPASADGKHLRSRTSRHAVSSSDNADATGLQNLLKNDVVEQGYPSSKRGYLYEILGNKAKTNGYYKRQKSRKMYPSKPCYWLLVSCY